MNRHHKVQFSLKTSKLYTSIFYDCKFKQAFIFRKKDDPVLEPGPKKNKPVEVTDCFQQPD